MEDDWKETCSKYDMSSSSLKENTLLMTISQHWFLFGEDNGTPLQYSCLENPMDGGAWNSAFQDEVMHMKGFG
ncbi:hypothetical protein AB1E18_001563 [Capra hircus]